MSRIYRQPPKPWNANIQAAAQGKSNPGEQRPLPADDLRSVVEQVGDAWDRLRGELVVITGASGFVGGWMTESLRTVLRSNHADLSGRFDYDVVYSTPGVGAWWPKHRPDYIIHATTDGVGWQHVAAVARAAGAKMLLLSSGAVYGEREDRKASKEVEWDCISGSGLLHKCTDYGRMKRDQERSCRDIAVIARLFSFIGPGLRRHAGRVFLEDDPITVNDDGAVRSYLYASDLATWLWTLLLRGQVGRAYNVGSGEAIEVTRFANVCGEARKTNVVKRWNKALVKIGTYYVPDVSRADQELGCRQTVGLDDAIKRTLAWQSS